MFLALLFISLPISAAEVLYIGDSHSVGPFGKKLDELIRNVPNIKLDFYSSCGSVCNWWENGRETSCGYFFKNNLGEVSQGKNIATPIFEQLIKKHKPSLVVVEIGANYWDYTQKKAIKDMKKMVRKIRKSGAACYWIGSPDSTKIKTSIPKIVRATEKAVKPYCKFFDSSLITSYPAGHADGLHYASEELKPVAEKWAQAVFEDLKPELYKVLLSTSTSLKKQGHNL